MEGLFEDSICHWTGEHILHTLLRNLNHAAILKQKSPCLEQRLYFLTSKKRLLICAKLHIYSDRTKGSSYLLR